MELVARADAARLRGRGSFAIPLRIGCECPNNGVSPITRPGSKNFTHIVTSGLGHPSGTDASSGILARFSRTNCAERMWGDKAPWYSLQVGCVPAPSNYLQFLTEATAGGAGRVLLHRIYEGNLPRTYPAGKFAAVR